MALRRTLIAIAALAAGIAAAEPVPDAAIRARSYDVLLRRMTHYVDAAVGARVIAALRADRARTLATPDNDRFMAAVNATLDAASHDRHLRIFLTHDTPAAAGAPPEERHGVEEVRRLTGDIAYLRLSGFSGDPRSVPAIDAAMARARGARALVIDLRDNTGGGEVSYRRLLGHLFPAAIELSGITWRTCTGAPRPSPDICVHGAPRTDRWFSDPPPRPAFARHPVYVLLSHKTFSAAEAVAYELRAHHRATIVGETSGGGANPSLGFDLESAFVVVMPIGRLHPVSALAPWEGIGIVPDIAAPADRALDAAVARIRKQR